MTTKPSKLASILQNVAMRLEFDPDAGGLSAITNKLTGETYTVHGDTFAVETTAWRRAQDQLHQVAWVATGETLTARYADADLSVEVVYELRPGDHFFQKRLAITFTAAGGAKQIVVSQPTFVLPGLDVVCYRHPDFDWLSEYVHAKHGFDLRRPADSDPARTFFGRTALGGFFTGVEMPYDNSRLQHGVLTLGYAPSLKVKAGECLACEPMYCGVYRRCGHDVRGAEWTSNVSQVIAKQEGCWSFDSITSAGFDSFAAANVGKKPAAAVASAKVLPLPSESAAMTAMTSALFGPPRHGLMAFAGGWSSQMEQDDYDSDSKLEADLRSLEFLASCGLDGLTDPHPWGGETRKLAALREGDAYVLGERSRRFLERAGELRLNVTQWPTLNTTHPWRPHGVPFRMDRPEWLRGLDGPAIPGVGCHGNFRRRQANCFACAPFYDWLENIILDGCMGTGLYGSWVMDGDFWGTDAFFNSILPVTCLAENHDHLPGDSNYGSQRMLQRMIDQVRRRHPGSYIQMCRPAQDLGVWALRNVDSCWTLIETGGGNSNINAGNEVRIASRIRVHHHFLPHWLDQSLLFPIYGDPKNQPPWPSDNIDYLLLSALSSTLNLLMYLPTRTGIPDADKATIRKWLDWGRKNLEYLLVRHDLFDWPAKGKVDGSAHLRGDHGLIFLFNPDKVERPAQFALTPESTGFTGAAPVELRQEYPASDRCQVHQPGAAVSWPVSGESAVVLRVAPGNPPRK